MAIIATALAFSSCEDSACDEEWGNSLVYMPQAALLSDGLNNCYPVPSQINGVNNYRVENGRIRVFLGVYRSGLPDLLPYSVQVVADADTCRQCVAAAAIVEHDECYDMYENAVVPAEDCFALPQTVNVAKGERSNTFYLDFDIEKMKSKGTALAGKTLVMAVRLKSTSRYALNERQSVTMVVVNGWENLQ